MTKKQQYYMQLRTIIFENFKYNNTDYDKLLYEIDYFINNQKILKRIPKNSKKEFLFFAMGDKLTCELFENNGELLDKLIKTSNIDNYKYESIEKFLYCTIRNIGLYNIIYTSPDVIALNFIKSLSSLIRKKYNNNPKCKEQEIILQNLKYKQELKLLQQKYNLRNKGE